MKHWNLMNTEHSTTASGSIDDTTRRAFRFEVTNADDDPTRMVKHFNDYFQTNYDACPVFFLGTLEEALKEAFQTRSMQDVRLSLHIQWERSLNRSSAVHSWSICITRELRSFVFSARRSSPTKDWSSIFETAILSGLGTSVQKRTDRSKREDHQHDLTFFSID